MIKKMEAPELGGVGTPVSSLAEDSAISNSTPNLLNSQPSYLHSDVIEVENVFLSKKIKSNLLANSYERIASIPKYLDEFKDEITSREYIRKAERVAVCSDWLYFLHEVKNNQVNPSGKLIKANFCTDRLCPQCNYRRSLKLYSQTCKLLTYLYKDYRFLFVTLTVVNCNFYDLEETLDKLFYSWKKFRQLKAFKKAFKGTFRTLEITFNKDTLTWHPHIHFISAVKESYFKSKYYVTNEKLLKMWQEACGDKNILKVDIQAVKYKKSKRKRNFEEYAQTCKETIDNHVDVTLDETLQAAKEVCSYATKDADYISGQFDKDSLEFDDKKVFILSSVLKHRRLVSCTGVFNKAAKELKMLDLNDDDLLHINDDTEMDDSVIYLLASFGWYDGLYNLSRQELLTKEQVLEKFNFSKNKNKNEKDKS